MCAASVAVLGVGMLAGCIPIAAPPVYSEPVAVVSASLSTTTVTAGQTVTFRLEATHPVGVTSVDAAPYDPVSTRLPDDFGCSSPSDQVSSGPATDLTVTITCTIPTIAPNGPWSFQYRVLADDSPVAAGSVPFTVTGGSDDVSPPQVVSADPPLSPHYVVIDPGQTFTLTVVVTDPHGPVVAPMEGAPVPCEDGVVETIAPDTYRVTLTCAQEPDNGPEIQVHIRDALGHVTYDATWAFWMSTWGPM